MALVVLPLIAHPLAMHFFWHEWSVLILVSYHYILYSVYSQNLVHAHFENYLVFVFSFFISLSLIHVSVKVVNKCRPY